MAGFGLDELTADAGFRAAVVAADILPRFSANVSDLTGVWCALEGATDVLLAALARGFFSASPDPVIEDEALWAELDDVEAVALLAAFFTTDPAGGRVGGLLNPPVVLEVGAY
jgi:hypothetical protein